MASKMLAMKGNESSTVAAAGSRGSECSPRQLRVQFHEDLGTAGVLVWAGNEGQRAGQNGCTQEKGVGSNEDGGWGKACKAAGCTTPAQAGTAAKPQMLLPKGWLRKCCRAHPHMKHGHSHTSLEKRFRMRPVGCASKKDTGRRSTVPSRRAWVRAAATMPPLAKEKARTCRSKIADMID